MKKSQTIEFIKIESLGNDFMIIDNKMLINLSASKIKKLANRHTGVGFDQLLIIDQDSPHSDCHFNIFNSDGSEAKQCINGLRAIAHHLFSKTDKAITLSISNKSGIFSATYDNDLIEASIPTQKAKIYADNTNVNISYVDFGNQHALVKVDNINTALIDKIVGAINNKNFFPEGCNISIYEQKAPGKLKARTIENGSGETLACGSAAVALAFAAANNDKANSKQELKIIQPGGTQSTTWQCNDYIKIKAPASIVFTGIVTL
ncbi:MAG: diaminopimelate epimerase [Legionellales bacterium]|jgi:diaminopimelate epimerase|nr:diaminopimelate epimerase [Legionellales bacterium]